MPSDRLIQPSTAAVNSLCHGASSPSSAGQNSRGTADSYLLSLLSFLLRLPKCLMLLHVVVEEIVCHFGYYREFPANTLPVLVRKILPQVHPWYCSHNAIWSDSQPCAQRCSTFVKRVSTPLSVVFTPCRSLPCSLLLVA